jgi:hypothetical protein
MADPRALFAAEGVGAEYISPKFDSTIVYDSTKSGGSASVGLGVTMVADKQVGLTQDGDVVVGKLIRVQSDGFCTVQIHGGMTLPAGNGATVTFNSRIVGALGAASAKGFIRNIAATTGAYVQATATETQKARGIILDAATSTAVLVYLD